ncbi:MAG: beta-ketoacyl synthase chain length factor, partial [Sulfuricaulis sp.]|nr:beta-ketoacyl synthase chain length factor [Sulfuricaulis sp.]
DFRSPALKLLIYVDGIGVWAPGLAGWAASREILAGGKSYQATVLPRPTPAILPPTERRRSSNTTLLAIQAAEEAVECAAANPQELATVFASSSGDLDILHDLCAALALPERQVSPTRFHNSVHNAAAGYWSIACGSQRPSTSLSGHDFTFAAGLIESIAQIAEECQPVLLVAYDWPPSLPLHAKRPLSAAFGVGMMLSSQKSERSIAALRIEMTTSCANKTSIMSDAGMETLRCGNPAARALPLLAVIARQQSAIVSLDYLDGNCLQIGVSRCA